MRRLRGFWSTVILEITYVSAACVRHLRLVCYTIVYISGALFLCAGCGDLHLLLFLCSPGLSRLHTYISIYIYWYTCIDNRYIYTHIFIYTDIWVYVLRISIPNSSIIDILFVCMFMHVHIYICMYSYIPAAIVILGAIP